MNSELFIRRKYEEARTVQRESTRDENQRKLFYGSPRSYASRTVLRRRFRCQNCSESCETAIQLTTWIETRKECAKLVSVFSLPLPHQLFLNFLLGIIPPKHIGVLLQEIELLCLLSTTDLGDFTISFRNLLEILISPPH